VFPDILGNVENLHTSDRFFRNLPACIVNSLFVGDHPTCIVSNLPNEDLLAFAIHMHSHSLGDNILLSHKIWTYRESLQFATADATTITIWEVGFISGGTPTEVEILPAPDDFGPIMATAGNPGLMILQFLPIPCLLSLTVKDRVLVWDVQNSRCLLDFTDIGPFPMPTLSSDGCFFAYTTSSNIYLWKKSPTGHMVHKIPTPKTGHLSKPLFSQNGESIAVYYNNTIWFWHTNSSTTHPSSILTQDLQRSEDFILGFSPDGILAVVARKESNTAMVLNLKSGVPQLTIGVDISVCGLGVIGNTVVVVCDWRVIAWDLPAEGCARVGLEDSSWTITLEDMAVVLGRSQEKGEQTGMWVVGASISPDACYIALTAEGVLTEGTDGYSHHLCIYSASTGECLDESYVYLPLYPRPWFSPDGCSIWCIDGRDKVVVWSVGGEGVLKRLGHIVNAEHPLEGSPWAPSYGYQITDDWWILGPDGKRLVMLPPLWQSKAVERVWKGQFLALLHGELSEPVILELEP
jgi:hypothetical protein